MASVNAQTVPVAHIVDIDVNGMGAGAMRNRLLEQVSTPFVVFLDADDTIHPQFVERTLNAMTPFNYVYTDWHEGNALKSTPENGWRDGFAHCITTMLHTDMALRVGGFDESLDGYEDTDFYLKLVTINYCGIRLPEPLFTYSSHGQRSKAIQDAGRADEFKQLMIQRYGEKIMSCCGNNEPPKVTGKQLPGDIKVQNMRTNTERVQGYATGRFYGRIRPQQVLWVNPQDAALQPQYWRKIIDIPKVTPSHDFTEPATQPLTGVDALTEFMIEQDMFARPAPDVLPVPDTVVAPDFARFNQLVQEAYQ